MIQLTPTIEYEEKLVVDKATLDAYIAREKIEVDSRSNSRWAAAVTYFVKEGILSKDMSSILIAALGQRPNYNYFLIGNVEDDYETSLRKIRKLSLDIDDYVLDYDDMPFEYLCWNNIPVSNDYNEIMSRMYPKDSTPIIRGSTLR
ncbi:hypothetical protein HN652_00975 [archaeon]|jgi:hypothetical protein|nr:hypothetical protein [archaeon]MBT6868936.1 hypothetical protein [archaeon]MBT7192843.1 hypothetical protein [archaeon]MBT7380809.1 hypothetical protein [archaeon]MBT7507564.1 hypothetical protein [archaeon]